jgi:hypothetical protein
LTLACLEEPSTAARVRAPRRRLRPCRGTRVGLMNARP